MDDNTEEKHYQIPCLIDGRYFATVTKAYEYLQEVNGRVGLRELKKCIRQGGRRVLEGHIISGAKTVDPFSMRG